MTDVLGKYRSGARSAQPEDPELMRLRPPSKAGRGLALLLMLTTSAVSGAVAWGLRSALRLSSIGPDDAAWRLVDRLPRRSLRGIDPARVREALGSDKKSVGGRPRFVLLDAPGRPRFGCEIADDVLERELGRMFAEGPFLEVQSS